MTILTMDQTRATVMTMETKQHLGPPSVLLRLSLRRQQRSYHLSIHPFHLRLRKRIPHLLPQRESCYQYLPCFQGYLRQQGKGPCSQNCLLLHQSYLRLLLRQSYPQLLQRLPESAPSQLLLPLASRSLAGQNFQKLHH